MQKSVIFLCLFFSLASFAQIDTANTYQYNRKNVLESNGVEDKGDWFEWWYFKVTHPKTGRSFFFVYGVVNPWDLFQTKSASRAYIGAGDFDKGLVLNQNVSVSHFGADYFTPHFMVKTPQGPFEATDKELVGEINENGHKITWNLTMSKEWSFNPIGRFLYKPDFLNIYWYPAQASAVMNGTVTVDGEVINLENAKAYQDRNWGRSFPKWWAWIVSNQFENAPDTYLTCGGGSPKVFNRYVLYEGMSVGFHHQGKEYHFRPHEGDFFQFKIEFGRWEIIGYSKKGYKIVVKAHAPKEKFLLLKFMSPQGVEFKDYEALNGHVDVELFKLNQDSPMLWDAITKVSSEYAGIEWGSFDDQLTIFDSKRTLQ